MNAEKFEDLISWQKAKELSLSVYSIFRDNRDFGFRDQIQRASISIGNNIAEGFERQSKKELKHFFFIAKGSCGEVRSMLHIALELGYIDKEAAGKLSGISIETSKLLSAFIKKVQSV